MNDKLHTFRIDEAVLKKALRQRITSTYIPSSVYRIQFSKDLSFSQTAAWVTYLKNLGIEALYASPYFETPPGSCHGYNITDPNKLNPELGSPEDYESMCAALRQCGMKQILDVVPNHMGIRGRNRIWMDVLENGAASIYASFFDINWQPEKVQLHNRVLLPVLGDHYGRILEKGEIQLFFLKGAFGIHYWDHEFPIDPKTYPVILECGLEELKESLGETSTEFLEYLSVITAFRNLPDRTETEAVRTAERNREKEIAKGRLAALAQQAAQVLDFIESRVVFFNGRKDDPHSFDVLNDLLNQQAYRMAYWRVASEEINYRRFFDINELAAFRIENDAAFDFHHHLVFELLRQGKIHGLRIDHPDGLYDPPAYFCKLQKRYLELLAEEEIARLAGHEDLEEEAKQRMIAGILQDEEFKEVKPLPVVVEKILDREEPLPRNWKVHGTVGYEYLNMLNGLFVNQSKQREFYGLYEKFIGHTIDFETLLYEKKKFFALIHMSSEVNNLGDRLKEVSERNRHYRDFTRSNLIVAIREVMACFPVYRTYLSPANTQVSNRDERYIRTAVEKAKRRTPALPADVYHFLREVLLLNLEFGQSEEDRRVCLEFALRFQQLTGPVMAKGLEDTAFYIYNRLLSLNEVGGDPTHFGYSIEEFHRQNHSRASLWPGSFVPASTHDTKRSEDVRMRLNVLSEIPERWEASIDRWSRLNEKHRTLVEDVFQPKRNTEYFIYQTLLGVWPDEDLGAKEHEAFRERIWLYLEKSLREGKLYTNWINPDLAYEEAVKRFLFSMLEPGEENKFLRDFLAFQKDISFYGKLNSLSGIVIRLGSPGVYDVYQGTELWNYKLVDPDNRGAVDFKQRSRLLEEVIRTCLPEGIPAGWMDRMTDGRIKLYLTWKGLQIRRSHPDLFIGGDYIPLQVEGRRKDHVTALLRKSGKKAAICAAGRFFTGLYPEAKRSDPGEAWADTAVILPEESGAESKWLDIFTARTFRPESGGGLRLPVRDLFRDLDAAMLISET